MLAAALSMTALGVGLGSVLGVAARKFHVDTPPILEEINALMPGTNCGQCGLAGCAAAASGIAEGSVPITVCPPGGRDLIEDLAALTGQEPGDLSGADDIVPQIAFVFEDHCTGCTKCFKRCPTDAIVGAAKQIHNVIPDACTGCNACVEVCPTEAIILRDKPQTLRGWYWERPAQPALEVTQ
ncbi:MAG: RnfABCDGE type electron transport complex subunit B [Maritimibacter sp.]|nr:RnfABCDGE type electron transport complex subunit B [Maritimibacter sp.]